MSDLLINWLVTMPNILCLRSSRSSPWTGLHHIASSPRFPQGNAHAEKAVGIVKQIYERCQDVKLGLLLLKTTPITNDCKFQASGNAFYGRQLKAHLPIYQSCTNLIENTCTLGAQGSAIFAQNDVPSKYAEGQDVWLKLDSSTKWMPGKVIQILPYQSYMVKLSDGHIFHRNEHHLTRRLSCIKPRATSEAGDTSHATKSYNLRPRKNIK